MSELNGYSRNKLSKGWEWKRLGDVVINLDGKRIPLSKHVRAKRKGQYRYYGATEIVDFIDDFIFDGEYLLIGEDGANLVSKSRPLAFIVEGKFWVNNHAHVLQSKDAVSQKYLCYYFNSLNLAPYVSGSAQPKLNQANLNKIPIPIPSKDEQVQIVCKIEELFSELDKSIEQLKTAQQQLKVYRQSVLKSAFEGKLSGNVLRTGFEPVSVAAEEETDYNIQRAQLPNGWKWVRLNDVVTNVEYGSSAKSKETGKVPVLRMGNIQRASFDWTDLVYTDNEEEISKYLLKKNDVLFNRTNSPELVGKTAIYKGERPAIFAGYLIRINRKEELIDAGYLNYFLNSGLAKHYGNSVKTDGVNQSNINGQKLKSYPIPLAPLDEQNAIVEEIESRFSVADKVEEGVNASLQQAEVLKQSILKKAFEGKLHQ